MKINVIDVSRYQGVIDFNQVKSAGFEGVIIKAGSGKSLNQKDPYFEINYKSAKRAGLHVGAYWYSYAKTIGNAKDEAIACLEVIKGKCFDLPIYYDVEEKSQIQEGSAFLEGIIDEFCQRLEAQKYFVGVYMSASYFKLVPVRVLVKYTLWVAQWNDKLTFNIIQPGMWQYTSKGQVPGIAGNVDKDYMLKDFPTIIRNAKLNGYGSLYDMDLMEQSIENDVDLTLLYELRSQLERLRDKYL